MFDNGPCINYSYSCFVLQVEKKQWSYWLVWELEDRLKSWQLGGDRPPFSLSSSWRSSAPQMEPCTSLARSWGLVFRGIDATFVLTSFSFLLMTRTLNSVCCLFAFLSVCGCILCLWICAQCDIKYEFIQSMIHIHMSHYHIIYLNSVEKGILHIHSSSIGQLLRSIVPNMLFFYSIFGTLITEVAT